jgi:hypothetical protein
MLREMLEAKHYQMTVVTAAQLSSEVLSLVEKERPAVLCIAALPPGGLAHARYLCLRLRARFPVLKIVVGRWGVNGNPEKSHERLQSAGADQIATTLEETRNQMLQLIQLVPQASSATKSGPAPDSLAST